jgi:tetratricopeptide (TPR) repeat protein
MLVPALARPLALARFLAIVSLIVAGMVGCASGSGSGTETRPPSAVAYDRGAYAEALSAATQEHRKTSGTKKEAAALTAGLASHALGDDAEAERWLTPLVDSSDRQIAARASAALGLIRADAGDHDRAIVLLTDAARVLPGNSGARAEFYAGESFAALGRTEAARARYRLAKAKAVDPQLKRIIDERLAGGGYTIQLGAFKSDANARKLVNEASAKSTAAGLGTPRVVAKTRPGAPTLYSVVVGSFASREEAQRALLRIGMPGIVTMATGA